MCNALLYNAMILLQQHAVTWRRKSVRMLHSLWRKTNSWVNCAKRWPIWVIYRGNDDLEFVALLEWGVICTIWRCSLLRLTEWGQKVDRKSGGGWWWLDERYSASEFHFRNYFRFRNLITSLTRRWTLKWQCGKSSLPFISASDSQAALSHLSTKSPGKPHLIESH